MPTIDTPPQQPHLAEDLVPRPALWAKLDVACSVPLTLVHAPAGYGKTTTVASWVDRRKHTDVWANTTAAWYAIDVLDDSLHPFCSRMIAAVRAVAPGACDQTVQMLGSSLVATPEHLALQFIRDLTLLQGHLVLILDDYHHISDPAIHAFVRTMVKRAPPMLSVVILTRRQLPFSVARLRSQNQLVELGLRDLQMNEAESRQLLSSVLQTELAPEAAARFHQHMAGWGAGIRLMALSLRSQPDAAWLKETMWDKPTRHIADYLLDEVLSEQPAPVQDFLLRTSILPELDGDVCAAALPPEASGQARAMLDYVVGYSLFVIPDNRAPGRYRYHDIFKAMLRGRLEHTHSQAEIDGLYQRVGQWYAKQGDLDRAIECDLAGHAPAAAVHLVEAHIPALQNREAWPQLNQYLARLPADRVEQNPALLLAREWVHQFYMHPGHIRATLEQVAQRLSDPDAGLAPEQMRRLRAETGLLAISPTVFAPTIELCERAVQEALAVLPRGSQFLRGNALLFLARQYQRHGQVDKALARLDEADRQADAQSHGFLIRLAHARCLILLYAARASEAALAADTCLRLAQQANLHSSVSFAHFIAGCTHYVAGQDEAAMRDFRLVLEHPYQSNLASLAVAALGMISMLADAGARDEAVRAAAQFSSLAQSAGNLEVLASTQMLEAAALVLSGRAAEAIPWLNAFDPDKVFPDRAYSGWVWGRGLLALGTREALARASAGLPGLIDRCMAVHVSSWAVELLAVLSRVQAARGEMAQGVAALARALQLGYAGRSWRGFLDDDPVLDELLIRAGHIPEHQEAADTLLRLRRERAASRSRRLPAALSAARAEAGAAQDAALDAAQGAAQDAALDAAQDAALDAALDAAAEAQLAIHLTRREIEILRLLMRHATDREIAEYLTLSVHTVRNHTRNLYAELGVHRRQDAITRAKKLRLV